MKMREYVDAIKGHGYWDKTHDLINKQILSGWDLIDIEVDGRTISIFPGTNKEVELEDVQNEIRRSLKELKI